MTPQHIKGPYLNSLIQKKVAECDNMCGVVTCVNSKGKQYIYIYVKRRGLSSKKYKSLTLKNKDNELHKLVVQQKRKKYAVSFASLKNPSS